MGFKLEPLHSPQPGSGVAPSIEKVKAEKWAQFRDRHGDSGRDQALYLGRKHGGMKLRELAEAVGLHRDANVAMILKRYEARLHTDRVEKKQLNKPSNC
jgi:hypothetical protein